MLAVSPSDIAVASIEIDVAYIDCGDSATGTQLAAIWPSGNAQSCASGSSSTGIAPDRYMQPSCTAVSGRQSGAVKLALVTEPDVPVICSATRLASRACSPASTAPEPLMSENGAAPVITKVAAVAGAPAASITGSGPPALLWTLPATGSKLAALTAPGPQISPGSHAGSAPDTRVSR